MTRRKIAAVAVAMTAVLMGAGRASAAPTRHLARFEPPDGTVYLGVSEPGGIANLNSYDRAAGISSGHPAVYNRYTAEDGPLAPALSDGSIAPGMAVMVSWNVSFTGGQVIDGSKDSYLRAQAAAVKAWGHPVFLRLDWEMNGSWYRDYSLNGGTSQREFIDSWRHVVKLFRNAGVTNVAWVWAPNVNEVSLDGTHYKTRSWYPGNGYVDWIGVDAYPQYAPWSYILNGRDGLDSIASFARAHHKPVALTEWSPNLPHPDSATPIDEVFSWIAAWPSTVKAELYFDYNTYTGDHTLVDHPVGAAELRKLTANRSRFLTSLVPPPVSS